LEFLTIINETYRNVNLFYINSRDYFTRFWDRR